MAYRYIPILRWKRGERGALERLSDAARQRTSPLFVVAADQYKERGNASAAQHIAGEIQKIAGSIPFFLDASALPDDAKSHPIDDIAAQARAAKLALIPAATMSCSPAYLRSIGKIAHADNRGVLLRTDLNGMTSASSWIGSWPMPVGQTDLLVDVADNVGKVLSLGAVVSDAFAGLHKGANWRSVTIAGTSMPENFSGYTSGAHVIPRAELSLWKQLHSYKLPYRLDYGDYATVPISVPPPGIKWGYPINVRYTLDNSFLICRGVSTTGIGGIEMEPQLINHAKMIKAHPDRSALSGCWADTTIDAVASGAEKPSNLERWVTIGVNRHIELVSVMLP